MQPMVNIATRAARAAGNVILKYVDRVQDLAVNEKGCNDFVSEVDRQAESEIINILQKSYPEHGILAEESGQHGKSDEYLWIIDPLDGTTNFLHGFPQFAVSIALQHRNKLVAAVIYDPLRQELFTASRGNGAYLDDRRIRVSKRKDLKGALLGTGFPFRNMENIERYIETFRILFPLTSGIRRPGSAALDLAYTACGRLDGFWEFGLKPWDIAAGALLIEESGGIVGSINPAGDYLKDGDVMAGNPGIYREIEKLLTNL